MRRPLIACVALVLLGASVPAQADERVLPAGSVCHVGDERIDLDVSHFLVERRTVDVCNACMRTRDQLIQATADAAAAAQRQVEPTWWTAAKWGGVGALVGLAFATGVIVGSD